MKAKKSLGQNFLIDDYYIKKIAELGQINHREICYEIGPGKGAITKELLKTYTKLVAVEIDERAIFELSKWNNPKLTLINKDILDCDLETLFSVENATIYGNLPYYISTKILLNFLDASEGAQHAVFMFQDELAKRICAEQKQKARGSLSVYAQFLAEVKYEFLVPKSAFEPMPKINSAVLTFNKKTVKFDKQKMTKLLKNIFKYKRKTLRKNLQKTFILDDGVVTEIYKLFNFEPNIRAEELSQGEIMKLYDFFVKNNKL